MSKDHSIIFPENENEESLLLMNDTNDADGTNNGEEHNNDMSWQYYKLVFIASLGGFLLGYGTSVISGAMVPLKRAFHLPVMYQEVVVSATVGGAILGASLSATLNDSYGRRPVLLLASLLFTIGSLILGIANGFFLLVLGRIDVGIGIGLGSTTVPTHMAESSPPAVRGKAITVFEVMVTLGVFSASIVNAAFSYIEKDSWRYMLGIGGVPSMVMFIGCFFIPESPRWLVQKGKVKEAREVLHTLRGHSEVEDELQEILDADLNDESDMSFKETLIQIFKSPSTKRALILGCNLQFIQQISAINTIQYYSTSIIELAGVLDEKTIIWFAAIVAFSDCLFAMTSLSFIEKFGRRKITLSAVFAVFVALYLIALTFLVLDHSSRPTTYKVPSRYAGKCASYSDCQTCVSSFSCGFCYVMDKSHSFNGSCLLVNTENIQGRSLFCNTSSYINKHQWNLSWSTKFCPSPYAWVAVASMVFYLAAFRSGLGPMPWTINAEIYPNWARGVCMSISTSVNWIMNLLISMTFLNLMKYLSRSGAFMFYGSFTFLGLVYLYFSLPETRGKKLEEIEILFKG